MAATVAGHIAQAPPAARRLLTQLRRAIRAAAPGVTERIGYWIATGCSVTTRLRPAARSQGQRSVWVCHGGRNAKWQRVASSAAGAHWRHGDTVSVTPQREGLACG